MKYLKGKLDFTDWNMFQDNEITVLLEPLILKTVADVIDIAIRDGIGDPDFPIMWGTHDGIGGPPVSDPLTMYMSFPFSNDGRDDPVYKFSLVDSIDQSIDFASDPAGNVTNHIGELVRLRDGLQKQIEKLNNAITKE